MNILGCLDRPTGGTYTLDGHAGRRARRRRPGLRCAAARSASSSRATTCCHGPVALENVATPLLYQGVSRKDRLARAQAALERLGLGDRLDHEPSELSGGQQQRVGDRPGARHRAGPDPGRRADRQPGQPPPAPKSGPLQGAHALGRTIVMITHDIDVATAADRGSTSATGSGSSSHEGHELLRLALSRLGTSARCGPP
jgi:putative ABC transport system ATP-binding protein